MLGCCLSAVQMQTIGMAAGTRRKVRWQKVPEGFKLSDTWEAFFVDYDADLGLIKTELLSDSGACEADDIRLLYNGDWCKFHHVPSLPVGDIEVKILVQKKGAQLAAHTTRSAICSHHVLLAQPSCPVNLHSCIAPTDPISHSQAKIEVHLQHHQCSVKQQKSCAASWRSLLVAVSLCQAISGMTFWQPKMSPVISGNLLRLWHQW